MIYTPLLQAKLAGHVAKPILTSERNKWKLTADDLRSSVINQEGPWFLVLTNPGNPSGSVYTRDELKSLTKVCREHNIIVLRYNSKLCI